LHIIIRKLIPSSTLGTAFSVQDSLQHYYPVIGLHSHGAEVSMNFTAKFPLNITATVVESQIPNKHHTMPALVPFLRSNSDHVYSPRKKMILEKNDNKARSDMDLRVQQQRKKNFTVNANTTKNNSSANNNNNRPRTGSGSGGSSSGSYSGARTSGNRDVDDTEVAEEGARGSLTETAPLQYTPAV
jgi:hypothetical protein